MGVLTDKVNEVNALTRANLVEHGINLDETTETDDIVSNIAKIPPSKYWNSVVSLYATASFPENTELIVDIPKCYDLTRFVCYTENLKKIKVSGNEGENLVNLTNAFQGSANLEEIDLTDFCLKVEVMNAGTFSTCPNLKRILGEFDLSSVSDTSLPTFVVPTLEEIRFKEGSIPKNLTMTACKNLSDDSVQSIINGLATVETQQKLTLYTNIVLKLTEEQLTTIANKNWTVG